LGGGCGDLGQRGGRLCCMCCIGAWFCAWGGILGATGAPEMA
jgi:hypothetical protein